MTQDDEQELDAAEAEGTVDAGSEAPAAAEGPRLVWLQDGVESDVSFALPESGIVGRFDPGTGPVEVDLAGVPDAAYVSRRHAKVEHADGVWTLRDLGSSNGTFVFRDDWERVEEVELVDGLQIAFGNAKFVFRAG